MICLSRFLTYELVGEPSEKVSEVAEQNAFVVHVCASHACVEQEKEQ